MDWPLVVSIVVPAGSLVGGAGALWQRLRSHEQQDQDRFELLQEMLTEVRSDIKDLLKGAHET